MSGRQQIQVLAEIILSYPSITYHMAPITLQQPCSLPEKAPMHVRSHTEQSDCGSSAFAHIFTIIQYELTAIKLLLQQLTIVPEALQFQDIPVNT